MKHKKIMAILLLSTSILGTMMPLAPTFAMERHAAYLERNYADRQGVMHHLTEQGHVLAEKEFANTDYAYTNTQIIDAFNDKQTAIAKLNETFKDATDDDVNYLVIESRGWIGGIIDFSFHELKDILDQYKGHFVIELAMGNPRDSLNKMLAKKFQLSFTEIFNDNTSKYNIYYSNMDFAKETGTKAYFESSQIGENGYLNADYNQDNVVTASELSSYLAQNNNTWLSNSFVSNPELPVFAKYNKETFDFYGNKTKPAHKETHFAQLKYNGDHTATLKGGLSMYGCPIHPAFKGIYASILAKDKDGNTLFMKEYKGINYVGANEENFSLPEGATLTLYHAEGPWHRFATSNNEELKTKLGKGGYTYTYKMQNNQLVLMDIK
ncbi:hypothetical protein GHK79_13500 [Enterococcus faecium]|uniref:putative mucin/carbohydrate-binding domain-containing protein n=1 Tax=Enterococcus faecium TaxID=1352 RepID=UPI0019230B8A|nr:putative mucin/carbohydrate-binding domain-containing protein [Enterococcus faecium]MBL3708789.1 hypothetical protein [Enterococcus faecium]